MAEEQNKFTRTLNKLLELIPSWMMVVAVLLAAIVIVLLNYKGLSESVAKIKEDFFQPKDNDTLIASETRQIQKWIPPKVGVPRKKSAYYYADSVSRTAEDLINDSKVTQLESQETGIPQTYKIGELKAKLISCSRNGSRVNFDIQISNSFDGNIVVW